MAQITLYIDDEVQARLRAVALRKQVSQSQFVADLIRRATAERWPDEVVALAGSLRDFPEAAELRAAQGADAERIV